MRENLRQLPTPPRSHGGIVLGLFIGLVIGVLIAFGVVWVLNKTPLPFQDNKGNHQERRESVPGQPPLPLAGKPGDKVSEKPRFDFYKILPGAEEAVTEQQIKEAAKPGAPAENYLLQVGSFQNPADADNLKARLALLGMEASVEPIDLAEKGTWYRVRVGPYSKVEEINRLRQTLAQNGIEASLVKIRDPGSH